MPESRCPAQTWSQRGQNLEGWWIVIRGNAWIEILRAKKWWWWLIELAAFEPEKCHLQESEEKMV